MLTVAVLAISSAAILVRMLDGAAPVSVAFWRTALTCLVLLPVVRRGLPDRSDLGWILLAGSFLAAHFVSWFASLGETTVLRSTVLVCTTPIWVGLIETLFFGARPGARFWAGTSLGCLGVAGFVASEPALATNREALEQLGAVALGTTAPKPMGWPTGASLHVASGDLLALLGAGLAAVYLMIGRRVRPRVDLATYGALVSGAAAIWLGISAWITGIGLMAFAPASWPWLVALALGPQLLGHNGFSYALRYVPAHRVAVLLLLEPVGAALLAAILLGEHPPVASIVPGAVLLLGVGLASLREPLSATDTPPLAALASSGHGPRHPASTDTAGH